MKASTGIESGAKLWEGPSLTLLVTYIPEQSAVGSAHRALGAADGERPGSEVHLLHILCEQLGTPPLCLQVPHPTSLLLIYIQVLGV